MAGLVRRVPRRKIGPRRTRSQDPHHSVEDVAHGPERSSPLRRRPAELLGGEEVLDRSPLLVGEVHGQGRSEIRPAVDLHRLSDRVPCTYAAAVMRRALVVADQPTSAMRGIRLQFSGRSRRSVLRAGLDQFCRTGRGSVLPNCLSRAVTRRTRRPRLRPPPTPPRACRPRPLLSPPRQAAARRLGVQTAALWRPVNFAQRTQVVGRQ